MADDTPSTSPLSKRQRRNQIRLQSILADELTAEIKYSDVYVATIKDPQNISKAIIQLNQKLPVMELQHLKRIKSRDILLCPYSWVDSNLDCSDVEHGKDLSEKLKFIFYLSSKGLDDECIKYFDITSVRRTYVPSQAPKTKRQYTFANRIWPCNFHSNKYLENLVENTLFTTKELEVHVKFLQLALEVRKYAQEKATLKNSNESCQKNCAVVITDPLRGDAIIAGGFSMTARNPILHGPMVAIDGVARTQNGGAYKDVVGIDLHWKELLTGQYKELIVIERNCIVNHNNKQHEDVNIAVNDDKNEMVASQEIKLTSNKVKNVSSDVLAATSNVNNKLEDNLNESEYLCTNYHVYMTHEPCVMCAMALIHSRAKRIFYIYPTENGALGTTCKIHTVKDLNHHYEVFKVHPEDISCLTK